MMNHHFKSGLLKNADSHAQVQAIVELVTAHSQRYALNLVKTPALPAGHRPFFDANEMSERRAWAKQLKGDAQKSVVTHLDKAKTLGATRRVAQAPKPSVLECLNRDFPHFADVTKHMQQAALLCRLGPSRHFKLSPILLAGDPGVGKTAYVQTAAKLLGVPFAKVDVGSLSASFSLSGLDMSYESGKPGLVWDLLQRECMSPLIVLDELDKLGADTRDAHLGPLYAMLEPVSATRFTDAAIGLPVNASYVSWLATCNDAACIEPALLSRFKRFDIPVPTRDQMRPILASIHRELRRNFDWAESFEDELPADVIAALCELTPREASQALPDAYANAAAQGRRHLTALDVCIRRTSPPARGMGFLKT